MSALYLSHVDIKDFRTFGEFGLPIPAGPGLTLLVGTNGLGKSNFFDALEWGLTGRVRRFEDYVGRLNEGEYLTRRDAPPNAHRVTLQFGDGSTLVRGMGAVLDTAELTALLKASDWTGIDDLSAYLAFTHFLGQAAQQRFTSREQSEQWQALKGPSGIDRLETIRNALRGKKTMNAFRRRAEFEALGVEAAELALAQWREKAERLRVLRERASVAGAEPAPVLGARLEALERALPGDPPGNTTTTARLIAVRQRITELTRAVEKDKAELPALRVLAERHAAALAQAQSAGERLKTAEVTLASATAALSTASLNASTLERDANQQAEVVALSERRMADLTRVRGLLAEQAELTSEQQRNMTDAAALETERAAREPELAAAREAVQKALQLQEELARLETEEAAWRRWSERVTELTIRDAEARVLRQAAGVAAASADEAANALPELQERVAVAAATAEDQAAKVAKIEQEASGLAALLSGIAAHIDHDSESCPVCASSFPPGRLKALALAAVAAQNARLAEEVAALDAARAHHRDVLELLAARQGQIAAATGADERARASEADAAGERQAIERALELASGQDLALYVSEQLRAAGAARAARIGEASGLANAAAAQELADTLDRNLVSLRERLAALAQRRGAVEARLQTIAEDIARDPEAADVSRMDGVTASRRAALTTARDRLAELQAARTTAVTEESSARDRLAAAQTERDRIRDAGAEAGKVIAETLAAWQAAGLDGHPNADAVNAHEDAQVKRAAELARQLDEQGALAAAYEILSAQEQLQRLQEAMTAEAGFGATEDPSAHERRLQANLDEARRLLRLTGVTREAIVAYAEQLKQEAEDFSSEFLLPLNDLIDAFNRALLSTPGETVQFNAAHTVERTSLGMQLRFADPIDNAIYRTDLPPQLVLSEGQMAANGFSILCAASTAYPWSRWRALLLDDPLQHNDIIHAAAFVDVMRNLVELEGYQLLMSSHKRDEGDFIARKFDAAGLPCTVVALTAASKDGVTFDPPRHNPAAQRLLAQAQAKAG